MGFKSKKVKPIINLTQLRQNKRQQRQKAGRKKARLGDFDVIAAPDAEAEKEDECHKSDEVHNMDLLNQDNIDHVNVESSDNENATQVTQQKEIDAVGWLGDESMNAFCILLKTQFPSHPVYRMCCCTPEIRLGSTKTEGR